MQALFGEEKRRILYSFRTHIYFEFEIRNPRWIWRKPVPRKPILDRIDYVGWQKRVVDKSLPCTSPKTIVKPPTPMPKTMKNHRATSLDHAPITRQPKKHQNVNTSSKNLSIIKKKTQRSQNLIKEPYRNSKSLKVRVKNLKETWSALQSLRGLVNSLKKPPLKSFIYI